MPKLPQILYHDLCRLIQEFTQESGGLGSPQVRGRNRNGVPFSIPTHPAHTVRPDVLIHVLRYLDVSPDGVSSLVPIIMCAIVARDTDRGIVPHPMRPSDPK